MSGNAAGQLMTGERWLRATKDSEYWGFPLGLNYGLLGRNNTTVISMRQHYRRREKHDRCQRREGSAQTQATEALKTNSQKGALLYRVPQKGALLYRIPQKARYCRYKVLVIDIINSGVYVHLGRRQKRLGDTVESWP